MTELKILSSPTMRRLVFELGHDKKRTFVLFVLLLAGSVMLVRMIARSPGSAKAAPAIEAARQATPKALQATPPFGALSGLTSERLAIATGKRITRDVFLFQEDYYPPAKGDEAGSKGSRPAADSRTKAQIVEQQARTSLALQSTFISADPTAVINGTVLRVGDWIDGFRIAEITSKTCVVEKEIDGQKIRASLVMD